MAKRRAGRKSNPKAKRKQTTRLGRGCAIDLGTAELRQHRISISGSDKAAIDIPLEVMAARHEAGKSFGLAAPLVQAGYQYAWMHGVVFGVTKSNIVRYGSDVGFETTLKMTESDVERVSEAYWFCTREILKNTTEGSLREFLRVCVHNEGYCYDRPIGRDLRNYDQLVAVLTALERYFRSSRQRCA